MDQRRFFVLNAKVLNYIDDDQTVWEREPVERLAREGPGPVICIEGFGLAWIPERKKYPRGSLGINKAPWRVWG
jgi:glucose-1-phosphate cytidylyltransferase